MSSTLSTGRPSIGHLVRDLGEAQKPGLGVPAYMRWVNRRWGRYCAAVAFRWRMSPTGVSVLSIVMTLTGLAAFLTLIAAEQPVIAGVAAAVMLAFGFALDSADGQLARLQGTSSIRGEWLDHSLDAVRLPTVHLVIAAGFLLAGWAPMAVVAMVYSVLASATFLSQNLAGLLRDKREGERERVRRLQSWLLLPADPGVLCWSFALWGIFPVFAVFYALLAVANASHMLLSAARRWRELGKADSGE